MHNPCGGDSLERHAQLYCIFGKRASRTNMIVFLLDEEEEWGEPDHPPYRPRL